MNDAINIAFESINSDTYILDSNGEVIPQTSSPEIIASMLRLLEVQPNMRVLEIGTGSGYSTAILAHLVDSSGFVTSLDIDPKLIDRADRLLKNEGIANVKLTTADGRMDIASTVPFDRIVAWATADVLPKSWVKQVCPDGLIVVPIQLRPLATATAIVCLRVSSAEKIVAEKMIRGGFVPLSSKPRNHWLGPAEKADIIMMEGEELIVWASAEWLKDKTKKAQAEQILQLLKTIASRRNLLQPDEDIEGLWAYLLATNPEGLTSAYTQTLGLCIGCSYPDSLALLSLFDKNYGEAGKDTASEALAAWIQDWRNSKCPGFEQLRPTVELTQQGWEVGTTL